MKRLAALALLLFLPGATGYAAKAKAHAALARTILADTNLSVTLDRARALLKNGFNAGSGYGEVWIRDFNTFIELALTVNDPATIRAQLLPFFRFQGADGNIVDGVIPMARANVGYQYRRSALEPGRLAHKNTVETDQESSLVLAVARHVAGTGDAAFLNEAVAGRTVRERLRQALAYVHQYRFNARYRLVWGATTVDWGDVQPEHVWGVEWDADSHPAIDIYDNALYLTALEAFVGLPGTTEADRTTWTDLAASIRKNVRKHLWDAKRAKFRPHIYLDRGSPFPVGFDEDGIHYHGGTTVAMEAGLLSSKELGVVWEQMRANRSAVGAGSIGLTIHPVYPEGFFRNPQLRPHSYQNGGDWTWFGGRTIQQLVRHGRVAEAYQEAQPMVSRALRDGFVEWYDLDNRPQGSREFRGAAGTLGQAIVLLQAWAREHVGGRE
jgi:glycogen debranching enzyme